MAILGNSRIKSLVVLEDIKAGNIEQTLSNDSTKIPSSKAVYDNSYGRQLLRLSLYRGHTGWYGIFPWL